MKDFFSEAFHIPHSKDFFARIEERLNLQAIGTYIRDGDLLNVLSKKPFHERMNEADEQLERAIKELLPDADKADSLLDAANDHQITLSAIYFSLGMKAGARLSLQLFGGFDKDY